MQARLLPPHTVFKTAQRAAEGRPGAQAASGVLYSVITPSCRRGPAVWSGSPSGVRPHGPDLYLCATRSRRQGVRRQSKVASLAFYISNRTAAGRFIQPNLCSSIARLCLRPPSRFCTSQVGQTLPHPSSARAKGKLQAIHRRRTLRMSPHHSRASWLQLRGALRPRHDELPSARGHAGLPSGLGPKNAN